MIDVNFDIKLVKSDLNGSKPQSERLLDDYELDMMLDHTKAQINQHIQRSLGDLRCEEHDLPPTILVRGTYSMETEQLEISYNIDTCCKPFLVRVIAALNRS